jgi:hypothetical protein
MRCQTRTVEVVDLLPSLGSAPPSLATPVISLISRPRPFYDVALSATDTLVLRLSKIFQVVVLLSHLCFILYAQEAFILTYDPPVSS